MPAAIRSLIRSRRKFQSGPAAVRQLLGDVGRQLVGPRTGRWAGGPGRSTPRRHRSSTRTNSSGTNSSAPALAAAPLLRADGGPVVLPAVPDRARPATRHAPPSLRTTRSPGVVGGEDGATPAAPRESARGPPRRCRRIDRCVRVGTRRRRRWRAPVRSERVPAPAPLVRPAGASERPAPEGVPRRRHRPRPSRSPARAPPLSPEGAPDARRAGRPVKPVPSHAGAGTRGGASHPPTLPADLLPRCPLCCACDGRAPVRSLGSRLL